MVALREAEGTVRDAGLWQETALPFMVAITLRRDGIRLVASGYLGLALALRQKVTTQRHGKRILSHGV